MAQSAAFIGIDWGTSNARFMLVSDHGIALDQRNGPGIGLLKCREEIERVCFDSICDWLEADAGIPVIMAGMVGSNIGWQPAPYVKTPASITAIVNSLTRFECRGSKFVIIPGLATRRPDGLPDTMRGEETQILGIATQPDEIICLPGTHSKWVGCKGGKITGFHSSLTGELVDVLACNSILLSDRKPVVAAPSNEFQRGVQASHDSSMGLESLLFSVRGRQLVGELEEGDAGDYLAGLVIGCEVRSALAQYGGTKSVVLVGASTLSALYRTAFESYEIEARWFSGDAASLSGLFEVYRRI